MLSHNIELNLNGWRLCHVLVFAGSFHFRAESCNFCSISLEIYDKQ